MTISYKFLYKKMIPYMLPLTVNDMRSYSHQMGESHFKAHQDAGRVGRVEFLPVRWHAALHGDATGVDRWVAKESFWLRYRSTYTVRWYRFSRKLLISEINI